LHFLFDSLRALYYDGVEGRGRLRLLELWSKDVRQSLSRPGCPLVKGAIAGRLFVV